MLRVELQCASCGRVEVLHWVKDTKSRYVPLENTSGEFVGFDVVKVPTAFGHLVIKATCKHRSVDVPIKWEFSPKGASPPL